MNSLTAKVCKDCRAAGGQIPNRAAIYPGPRCATHNREFVKRSKALAHARHIESTYEITADEYAAILEAQGGRCAICQRANGRTKRMAVEHDHELAKLHGHPVDRGCRRCIRGIVCGRCNRYGVPLFLDAVIRAVNYLTDPPARKVLIDAA